MDDIETRLKTTSENCLTAFVTWDKDRKDVKTRESLQETVHELRKVAARLEIEIAASERSEGTQKKIPIPHHRSSRKKINNDDDSGSNGVDSGAPQVRKKRPPRKAQASS